MYLDGVRQGDRWRKKTSNIHHTEIYEIKFFIPSRGGRKKREPDSHKFNDIEDFSIFFFFVLLLPLFAYLILHTYSYRRNVVPYNAQYIYAHRFPGLFCCLSTEYDVVRCTSSAVAAVAYDDDDVCIWMCWCSLCVFFLASLFT